MWTPADHPAVHTEALPTTYLQGCLALVHQPLHQVVLGFSQELFYLSAALGERHSAVTQIVQDCPKMLPAAVNQDPA